MAAIHTFVSFKGGTGRSVTTANVAYQAARLGKRVLVVDLDIDGPGIATLARLDEAVVQQRSVVTYLHGPAMESPLDYVITKNFPTPEGGEVAIDFLAAPMMGEAKDSLPTFGQALAEKMSLFRASVLPNYDAIFIDAASGISDYTALAFSVSDFITVCTRWSRQQVMGTLKLMVLLDRLVRRKSYYLSKYVLLLNAVPIPALAHEINRQREVEAMFRTAFAELGNVDAQIHTINEINDFKWDEGIATDIGRGLDDYERYARFCLKQQDGLAKAGAGS